MTDRTDRWPALDYASWSDTLMTFRLWVQMVGKVRLAHEPWLNHSWHVPLYASANGLTTSVVHARDTAFEIEFDLVGGRLVVRTSDHADVGFRLEPMSVAEFHARLVGTLGAAGIDARFDGMPNEIPDAVPFAEDEIHRSYDADAVRRFWRALLSVDRVFKRFRTGFIGKASPVHLFWGSFDLAVTRFSGREAPMHPGGVPGLPDAVAREAYDHEVSSVGFWPGDASHPEPAFYSYAYPAPDGFADAAVAPGQATFSKETGEWLLPYEAVRTADDPDAALEAFLTSTYRAAADLARWDPSLECAPGEPRRPRTPDPMPDAGGQRATGRTREVEGIPAPESGFAVTLFLVVADVERSARFYSEVLGGTVTRKADPTVVRLGDAWIIMNPGGGPTPDKPAVTLATPNREAPVSAFMNLRVADIDAAHRDWTARGARFLTPPLPNGDERRCYIVDPDGHLIEVGEHV